MNARGIRKIVNHIVFNQAYVLSILLIFAVSCAAQPKPATSAPPPEPPTPPTKPSEPEPERPSELHLFKPTAATVEEVNFDEPSAVVEIANLAFSGKLNETQFTAAEQLLKRGDGTHQELSASLGAPRQNGAISVLPDVSADLTYHSKGDVLFIAHYMPWFQTPEVSGYWGMHWTMNTCNPNIQVAERRQICAHHYPLIGTYDSTDPHLLEYHALLMRLSGIDGVFIDWYGVIDKFDWGTLKRATEVIADAFAAYDLSIALVYEDKTLNTMTAFNLLIETQSAGVDVLRYLKESFFTRSNYLHMDKKPLLLNYGPFHFTRGEQWQELFTLSETEPYYFGLWRLEGLTNQFFSWIYADTNFLPWFYNVSHWDTWPVTIGEAFPMFKDYYKEGGWGENLFEISADEGKTFRRTLNYALDKGATIIQLNTWNDFGEGSDIEPTLEHEYRYLSDLQYVSGNAHTVNDLKLVTRLYQARKAYVDDDTVQQDLDRVGPALLNFDIVLAKKILDNLPSQSTAP